MTVQCPLEIRVRQLFPETEGARVDAVSMLSDVQREPIWQQLRSLHCELKWVELTEIDLHAGDGWTPVIARHGDTAYFYIDRTCSRTLMLKTPSQE